MKQFCIVIPFHNPWVWHTDYANQTALLLSKHYTVICYLWGDAISVKELIAHKKIYIPITHKKNLWFYHPLYLIPGKRFIPIQYINMFFNLIWIYLFSAFLALYEKRTVLFWFFGIFDPVFILLPLFFRRTRTVYDCVDAPSHPNPVIENRLKQSERRLLSYAWVVTANSRTMQTRLLPMRPNTQLVPLGFRDTMFHDPKSYTLNLDRSRPIIGYIGAIDYRINIPLIEQLTHIHPDWQFALIGPVFDDHLSLQSQSRLRRLLTKQNVYHTCVPSAYIPAILSACDVTIIPYRNDSTFNQYAFPMKTMEYLYAQKQVIASHEIKELHWYSPLVLPASGVREWEKLLARAIHTGLNIQQKRRARTIAKNHTWEQKISALGQIIEKTSFDSRPQ